MMTITIATDITATLSNHKAEQWFKAVKVSQSCREAFRSHMWKWQDLALWEEDEWEAWEEFCS